MTVLLFASLAVTVNVTALPAAALAGAADHEVRCGRRVDGHVPLPVSEPLTVSVAVIVWLPAVFKLTLKEPVPLVKVELAGSAAAASLLVKWTVPV